VARVSLPTLPTTAELVTAAEAVELERRVAAVVAELVDVDEALEWHARADALAAYLARTDSHGPMQGAMRRIEARIGELLGETSQGKRTDLTVSRARQLRRRQDRVEFRRLADAVKADLLDYAADGEDSRWRRSRRALLEALRDELRAARRDERVTQLGEDRARLEDEARAELQRLEAAGGQPFELVVGDVRTWRPNRPVHAVITDPPYVTDDAVELYAELARFALDALEPGGVLAAMVPSWLLKKVILAMHEAVAERLVYRWAIVWQFASNANTLDYARRVFDRTKLVLVFHRGPWSDHAPVFDDFIGSLGRDKGLHPWQQSLEGFERLVTSLTRPGDVVCDPFTGAGTTAVVALRNLRTFVGCDIDPAAVETTRRRLEAAS
jgi:hypothetical protein